MPVETPVPGTAARSTRRRWFPAVAIGFALLYAYDLFGAISNALAYPALIASRNASAASVGLPAVPVPWAVLIAGLLLSPVAYLLAYWLARRGSAPRQTLVFLVGLGLVAALTRSLSALG